MGVLARGAVGDRPWGRTFATIALRGSTGQLALTVDGKRYVVAFVEGAVSAASSPLATDAAVRVALTSGLVSSSQVADIARRQQANPQRDEIEIIAEALKLGTDQALRLRRRVIAQRAARTFSVDRGEFVVDEIVTLPLVPGTELDVRAVVYLGARQNLSEARLEAELLQLGTHFRLKPEATDDLPYFGFGDQERPLLERLVAGARVTELLAIPQVEARVVRALVYALACCGACDAQGGRRTTPTPDVAYAATQAMPTFPDAHTTGAPDTPTVRRAKTLDPKTMLRKRATTQRPALPRKRTDSAQASDVKALIDQRLDLMNSSADHYALLGVPQDADADAIRKGYFALARQLHPDRLSALGIPDPDRHAQRLFAQVNTAFAVLSDPRRRYEYTEILKRGGEAAVRAEQHKAEQMAQRVLEAEEAFLRGEMAMRRDQSATAVVEFARALELNPDESDYHAMHAWASFIAAPDKMAIAAKTRSTLEAAITRAPRAMAARFYLGRVERMLGRDKEALEHFQFVLKLSPGHAEAASEARVIEARLAAKEDKGTTGLFGRKR